MGVHVLRQPDGDGISDYDEVTYGDRLAGLTPNPTDYNPYDPVTNPTGKDLNAVKADTDGDGLSDGAEINIYHTNPLNPDTDGDGLTDGQEVALGLNPLVRDTDGDGFEDAFELAAGSGATVLSSRPLSSQLLQIDGFTYANGRMAVRFGLSHGIGTLGRNVGVWLEAAPAVRGLWTRLTVGEVDMPQGTTSATLFSIAPADSIPGTNEYYRLKWRLK